MANMIDDEISSLFSLLGLLEPSEFFVTVDHSSLWQKHISWAKSGGEDLRQHITQRFTSSMVFLSCLLAAQINVFFNSSKEITEMRACLATQRMSTLKYWIGVVVMMDICVTILALVNTYTLSKIISSISDSNAHAMLRSSIGSYVAVLPSRFTVAALYLFLLWIAMFIWEIFAGPIHFILLLLVLAMFFHVIIPLSAFGRLIIHTGAMGRRPVLDVELEKELLPSGLHNSLLIRATDRKRKYKSSATDQYRRKHGSRSHRIMGSSIPSGYGTSNASQRLPRDIVVSERRPEDDDLTLEGVDDVAHEDDEGLEGLEIHSDYASDMMMDPELAISRGQSGSESSGNIGHHRRLQTMDTVGSENFFFPQASVLNATTRTMDIQKIVKQSMSLSEAGHDASTTAPSGVFSHQTPPTFTGDYSVGTTDPTPIHRNDTAPEQTGAAEPKGDNAAAKAGTMHNTATTTGPARQHRRIPSSGTPLPPTTPELSNIMDYDIHAGMRYADFTSPPPPQQQETSQFHPLLDTPSNSDSPSLPPTSSQRRSNRSHHRRRSRRSSSGSILGFIPSPLAENELREENAIRASLDMPLAPDLESQERLMEEQMIQQQQQNAARQPTEAGSSTWLSMHTPSSAGVGSSSRRRSFSSGHVRSSEEASFYPTPPLQPRSNSRRNLMSPPAQQVPTSDDYRSSANRRSGSRRSLLARQGSGNGSSGRNLMETIRSHPDEEIEDVEDDTRRPEETTRLLERTDQGTSGGDSSGQNNFRRSYT